MFQSKQSAISKGVLLLGVDTFNFIRSRVKKWLIEIISLDGYSIKWK